MRASVPDLPPARRRAKKRGHTAPPGSLRRFLFTMRPEEVMTLVVFAPVAVALAVVAVRPGAYGADPPGYPGALARLVILLCTVAFTLWAVRTKPRWELMRDALPFLFCGNVYASLHDLIRFYGFPDVTQALYRADLALFGVEPTVWAQQFTHPFWVDFLSICYWLFYVTPPLLGLILYRKKMRPQFRETLVSIVLCLYLGYVGYVVLPASAPRLVIPEQFPEPLRGLWPPLTQTFFATKAIPLTAHGAFPSLHCAVALLATLLAWRHLRWFFPIQLVLGTGLIVGTVYLRHHWVVDILAGFVLTFFSLWAGPRLERWWEAHAARWVPARELARANIDSGARRTRGDAEAASA